MTPSRCILWIPLRRWWSCPAPGSFPSTPTQWLSSSRSSPSRQKSIRCWKAFQTTSQSGISTWWTPGTARFPSLLGRVITTRKCRSESIWWSTSQSKASRSGTPEFITWASVPMKTQWSITGLSADWHGKQMTDSDSTGATSAVSNLIGQQIQASLDFD